MTFAEWEKLSDNDPKKIEVARRIWLGCTKWMEDRGNLALANRMKQRWVKARAPK